MDESYSSLLASGVEKQLRALEMSIMEDIVRRIRKAGTITDAADWQIQRLIILGNSTQDIEDLIREAVGGSEEEVRRIYEEVIAREYTRDKSLYEQIGKEFIPYDQNRELQQLVNAMVRQSSEELYNITKSTGFMLSDGHGGKVYTPTADVYNRYLDEAITGMVSGAYDYNTLIRRMVNEMTNSGLRTDHAFSDGGSNYGVDYASGWHNRIDVAARRALLTGMSQVTGRITEENAQRLGTDYFEVTWHSGARPSHAVWQGKVYTKEQLVRICGLGTGPGLDGWNCQHSYYPFIPGVSERLYTDEWLAEQNARENTPRLYRGREYTTYEATQKQRQMETSLRAQREKVQLLREGGADKDDITLAQCKYQAKLDEYKTFSKAMELPEQAERIYTGRTKGRIAPSPQTYAKYKAAQAQKVQAAPKTAAPTASTSKAAAPKAPTSSLPTLKNLQATGADYVPVKKRSTARPEAEIIAKIGGGDMTSGSCASVALAYAGQKLGLDVFDFRGGKSMDFFSSKLNKVQMFKDLGATTIVSDTAKTNFTNGKRILAQLEEGKEYYLSVGRHAAIVRKQGGQIQYLELQSSRSNGWKDFDSSGYVLKNRFGCSSSSSYYSTAYATEISQLKGDDFEQILCYINTEESNQKKGVAGSVK